MPPALFFLLRFVLAILGLLGFHLNFRIICSCSMKNVLHNLLGITLGSITILTMLTVPNSRALDPSS